MSMLNFDTCAAAQVRLDDVRQSNGLRAVLAQVKQSATAVNELIGMFSCRRTGFIYARVAQTPSLYLRFLSDSTF